MTIPRISRRYMPSLARLPGEVVLVASVKGFLPRGERDFVENIWLAVRH
jgi:hypothetical protein